jgi:hypothetical protein
MGGDAKRKQEAKARIWRWCLTLGERIEVWRLLLGRNPPSEEVDELNTRAIEAIEDDDEFEPPPHMKAEERKKWHEEFNKRIVSDERDELSVTLEDVEQIRDGIRDAIALNEEDEKNAKDPKGARGAKKGQWDGAKGYRLRHVKRAVRAAMKGDSVDGVIWPLPEPKAKAEGDNGSPPRKRKPKAKRPKTDEAAAE